MIETDDVSLLCNGVEKDIFPHLHLIPQVTTRTADENFEQVLFIAGADGTVLDDLTERSVAKSKRVRSASDLHELSTDLYPAENELLASETLESCFALSLSSFN